MTDQHPITPVFEPIGEEIEIPPHMQSIVEAILCFWELQEESGGSSEEIKQLIQSIVDWTITIAPSTVKAWKEEEAAQ